MRIIADKNTTWGAEADNINANFAEVSYRFAYVSSELLDNRIYVEIKVVGETAPIAGSFSMILTSSV